MFFIPFWVFFTIVLILAGVTIRIRKLKFIDIQVMIFIIAVSMSCDMIFCKQLKLYHYVDMTIRYIGWYSFWANFFIVPLLGLIFIKFIPSGKVRVVIYIIAWSTVFTLLEAFILKPSGILHILSWKTIPWSPVGYFLALTLECFYFRYLGKKIPDSNQFGGRIQE